MQPIKKTYQIKAPVTKVWQALTDPKIMAKWGGPAEMDLKAGGKFLIWGGDIFGINTKVEPPRLLEQDWQYEGWAKPSKVVFELSGKSGETTLKLTHANVPAEEVKNIDDGWDEYYLGPLKRLVE